MDCGKGHVAEGVGVDALGAQKGVGGGARLLVGDVCTWAYRRSGLAGISKASRPRPKSATAAMRSSRAERARRHARSGGAGAASGGVSAAPLFVAIQKAGLRLEAAVPPVGDQRDHHGQHDDAGAGRAGELEVQALRAHQQHGAVHGVHRVVPDERRQNAPAQHDEAQGHAADADFHAADVERLLRISGVSEAPDEAREHHGRHGVTHQLAQERNGEHAEEKLFRDRRQEAAEQHEQPGESRIEQVAVRDIGGRPCAELVGHDVERRLIGDEDAGERDAENGAEEEALGAQAAQAEEIAQRDFVAEGFAVERLGAGGENEEEAARSRARR